MKYNLLMLRQHSILFVEDDLIMLKETSELLSIFFASVYQSTSVQSAMESYYDNKPSIIVTDLGLPDGDGLKFIQEIRQIDRDIPIIILTAYSDQDRLLKAANLKIDGYLLKPLVLETLLEKIGYALEHSKNFSANYLLNSKTYYNFKIKTLYINNEPIQLGKKELQLFELFLQYPNKILSKEEIIRLIWSDEEVSESAFKNLLSRLRQKIGKDIIDVNPGIGWYLVKRDL